MPLLHAKPRALTLILLLLLVAAIAGRASSAYASGSADIASAPQLVFGGITSGGGLSDEYWRVPLVAGDLVTFRWDQSGNDWTHTTQASLYDPSVDDYRLANAQPLVRADQAKLGKSEFTMVSPFSGNGILRVQGTYYRSPSFSFVATAEHKTAILVSKPPSLVNKPTTRFAVSARVVAEAGVATGHCLFERITGAKVAQLASVAVENGACRTMARTNSRTPVRLRVSYLPDDGWQPSDALSTLVRTRKAKRSSHTARIAKKKRVCQKVMSHGKITNYCRTIETLAGTDCKHPFKVFYFFAGPGVKGAKKYGTLNVEWLHDGPPNYGTIPRITWDRTDIGVVCKVEVKQNDQPDWSSTAQHGTHDFPVMPGQQVDGSYPNRVHSIVLWVRKAHKK